MAVRVAMCPENPGSVHDAVIVGTRKGAASTDSLLLQEQRVFLSRSFFPNVSFYPVRH